MGTDGIVDISDLAGTIMEGAEGENVESWQAGRNEAREDVVRNMVTTSSFYDCMA